MDKKKIILLVISAVVIIGLVIFLIGIKNNEVTPDEKIDGVEIVKAEELIKEQVIDNLKFSNISLIIMNGESNFYATVTNQSPVDYQINNLYINFLGDNLDHKALALSNLSLAPGASTEIRLMIDTDLTNAKSVKYLLENAN